MERPLFYLILGPTGSGRLDLLDTLIHDGTPDASSRILLRHPEEADQALETRLKNQEDTHVLDWDWEDGHLRAPALNPKAGGPDDVIFMLAQGSDNPLPQIEHLREMLAHYLWDLGRILTVVDCELAHREAALRPWWDACIHFSDVVLLNRHNDVPKKWQKAFEEHYTREQHMPCLFVPVKKKGLDNPLFVLEPQARRLSLYFDDLEELDEEDAAAEAEEGMTPGEETYFEKIPETGHYRRKLPEIGAYL